MKKRIHSVTLAAALSAGLGFAAFSQTVQAQAPAPMTQESTQGNFVGEHEMTGTVTSINHKTGVIDLKTKEAKMRLHFLPKDITDLKKGEKITVKLSYMKAQ